MFPRLLLLGLVAALWAATGASVPAAAAAPDNPDDLPSVIVQPASPAAGDPNEGQWFIVDGDPGGEVTSTARISNVADVAQRVRLFVADLRFNADGTPELHEGDQAGVGLWARVARSELVVPAQGSVEVDFAVLVPLDAEPGDHVGGLVAETSVAGDQFTINRRAVRRLYVTVPGDARRSFVIESVETERQSFLWPRRATATAVLRNDGRVRLSPTVTIRDEPAEGARLVMSQSVEPYVADVALPWYGGLVRFPVRATTDGGLVRTVTATKIIVPWGLLLALVLLAALAYLGRRWWTKRGSTTAELRADIQRLERIVTQQVAAAGAPAVAAEAEQPDEEALLRAAWKRAQRAGDGAALARVALGLHGITGDAEHYIVEAMEHDARKHRAALELALADYEEAPKPKPAAKKAAPKKKAAPRKPAGSTGHKTAKRSPAKKR